ncbi:MAG TPA: DUF2752 domain-containing protein [Thermoanaerobaculia bacterium]|nr:DUF2752 domain-containing protein [Thermoanaerobaculia bacterium]
MASLFHVWVPPEDPRFVVCLFRRLTGIPCPGCGMTRAFAHLAKGEWEAAWISHPLSFVLAPQIGLAWLAWGLALAGRLRLALDDPRIPRALIGEAAVLLAFWLGRLATGSLPG